MATLRVSSLGEYIREQRRNAQYSLRQLAEVAGVSNPYLSQIERGLRRPSAEILQQIAKALRISAEQLYIRAGILEESDDRRVEAAILADTSITERQKRVLLEIYESFRRETATTTARNSGPETVATAEASQGRAHDGDHDRAQEAHGIEGVVRRGRGGRPRDREAS